MDQIKKHFRYKKVENFLTKEETKLLLRYTELCHKINDHNHEPSDGLMHTGETAFYGSPIMDSLLLNKCLLMEQHTGISLYPTYSYWRMYTKGSLLPNHRDRPACEVSVTVNLGGDKSWPFIVDNKPYDMSPGDALIYLGRELFHAREPYDGDWQAQIFLHYVDAEGKHSKEYKDGRKFFGMGVRHRNAI